MALKRVSTNDAGVIVLSKTFAASSLPNVTINNESISYNRYILFPKTLLDISQISNIRSIYFNIKYDITRSAGSATSNIYGVYGTTSSNTEFRNKFITQSSNQTDYILQVNLVAGLADSDIQKYVNDTYIFTYNGNEYYCVRYWGDFGSTFSKYTGSLHLKEVALGVEYDESTKIYNGSNGITSAYLGSTPINGIYLGSQKLL